jgi:hypothetical protein
MTGALGFQTKAFRHFVVAEAVVTKLDHLALGSRQASVDALKVTAQVGPFLGRRKRRLPLCRNRDLRVDPITSLPVVIATIAQSGQYPSLGVLDGLPLEEQSDESFLKEILRILGWDFRFPEDPDEVRLEAREKPLERGVLQRCARDPHRFDLSLESRE